MATKTSKTYNGWPNRAAWNVALWVGNDEGMYRTMLDRRAGLPRKRFNADTAHDFAAELWPDGFTPDRDRIADVSKTGWAHIARAWNEA